MKTLRRLINPFLNTLLFFSVAALISSNAFADGAKHKLVIQVSTDDARTQKIAMNNAVNLQKLYGPDGVDIEIVAYGPGLGMMTSKSEFSKRVQSLVVQDIKFSACMNTMNTMNKIKAKKGHLPKLSEGVGTVKAGVARIMELQEQGYSYVRP